VVSVAVDGEGRLFLDDRPAEPAQIADRARTAAKANPDTEVQLRADSHVPYGRVAELIAVVQQAGLSRIGLVTEAPDRAR
jgi:biopolymer transport protein ExbD